jgi:hypothetical protein
LNISQFYNLIVEQGMQRDPRGKSGVLKYLKSVKDEYKTLPPDEKDTFDKERLSNPYSDTRILFGSVQAKVETIMLGIDIETPELLLADRLREKGQAIDLVVSHHPEGRAMAGLYRVMNVISDILRSVGVSSPKVKKMLDERMEEVSRKIIASNCPRAVDAARLLDIPFMCIPWRTILPINILII